MTRIMEDILFHHIHCSSDGGVDATGNTVRASNNLGSGSGPGDKHNFSLPTGFLSKVLSSFANGLSLTLTKYVRILCISYAFIY